MTPCPTPCSSRAQMRSAKSAERSAAFGTARVNSATAGVARAAMPAQSARTTPKLRKATTGDLCDVAVPGFEDHRLALDEVADGDDSFVDLEMGGAVAAIGDQPDRPPHRRRAVAADGLVVAGAAAPELASAAARAAGAALSTMAAARFPFLAALAPGQAEHRRLVVACLLVEVELPTPEQGRLG